MEKKYITSSEENESETSAWNQANKFSGEVIMDSIIQIKKYRTLAIFGFQNLEQDVLINNPMLKSIARIASLRRLTDEIKSLIVFSGFILKKPELQTIFTNHTKRIEKIEANIYRLEISKKRGNRVSEINLDEQMFGLMMSDISKITSSILNLLNLSGIIFKQTEIKDLTKSITDM